jgi:galactokinase
MKKKLIKETTQYFKKVFNTEPEYTFLSPGRINIIGEHIDYNDGYVLPAAINKHICFTISKTKDSECTIVAKDLNDAYKFNISDELIPIEKMWANYILGVLQQLKERGYTCSGFQMVFSSTIPIGAGLSSSAALECGVGYAMSIMNSLELTKEDIALIGQKSEHTFAGVNCGIMDQFASVFGKKNKVIKLDCNNLDYTYYPAQFKNFSVVLLDSMVKHTHLTSGYNTRREEVEEGLAIIKNTFPEINSFRDCQKSHVEAVKEKLGTTIYKRCAFVVEEIQRVKDATQALEKNDIVELGKLMSKTHQGLSHDYEVSCEEIDFLVTLLQDEKKVVGSRMMGGGFGGCTINFIKKGHEKDVIEKASKAYREKFGIELKAYKVKISKGTTQIQKQDGKI